jgi:hypothetical protein
MITLWIGITFIGLALEVWKMALDKRVAILAEDNARLRAILTALVYDPDLRLVVEEPEPKFKNYRTPRLG